MKSQLSLKELSEIDSNNGNLKDDEQSIGEKFAPSQRYKSQNIDKKQEVRDSFKSGNGISMEIDEGHSVNPVQSRVRRVMHVDSNINPNLTKVEPDNLPPINLPKRKIMRKKIEERTSQPARNSQN